MKIALDLDNTITADRNTIEFFRTLTHLLHPDPEHHIVILTNREPGTEQLIAEELDQYGISYNEIVITASKVQYIKGHRVNVYFENEDEYFLELGEETTVFKIREDGNFSFTEKKWIGSKKTTKLIDE